MYIPLCPAEQTIHIDQFPSQNSGMCFVCFLYVFCMFFVRSMFFVWLWKWLVAMYVLCMFYVCFMYVLCMFYVCFMYVLCMFYVCFMYVLCMFYVCFMYVLCITMINCNLTVNYRRWGLERPHVFHFLLQVVLIL